MKSIVIAWKNRRRISANVRPIESPRASSPSGSSNQDSAYGSLTVFSSAASVASVQSQRSSIHSSTYHNSTKLKNEKSRKESSLKKIKPQQQQPHHNASNVGPIESPSAGSLARIMSTLSRILSGKKELPDDTHIQHQHSSLTDTENDQHVNGSLFQQLHPRLVVETISPSFTSIHPLCISEGSLAHTPMIMPIPDVTAPACYPGAGSADLAVKQQQLLQLQISSRRPSASSLNLTLNSPISQRRNSRHLIPHHNFEHGGNGGPNNHQDTLGYGSPLASRRSSVGSIASGLYPTPSLPLQSGLNSNFSTSHQSSVSSWTALSQNRRPSVQSMSDIEFIPGAVPKTGQSQKRRGSTFSIASDGLALSTRDRKKAVPSRMMKLGQGYDISTMFHVEPQS